MEIKMEIKTVSVTELRKGDVVLVDDYRVHRLNRLTDGMVQVVDTAGWTYDYYPDVQLRVARGKGAKQRGVL